MSGADNADRAKRREKADGAGMRALKVLTVGMAVLIVLGSGALVAVIVHRMSGAPPAVVPETLAVTLDEPAGTRIAAIAVVADRLAVQLQGGGPDRVVLVDPRSGAVAGRIDLSR
jgi:hypothetical protein